MKELSNYQFRIIDANINRLSEGLRVLEEFARMMLNDAALTQKLKDMRHQTVETTAELYKYFLQSRDAAGDIGSDMDVTGESNKPEPQGIIAANAKRAQESLRVLEEMSKIPALNLDSKRYRRARFELYTVEKELVARVSRKDKLERLKGLYVIVDASWLKGRKPADIAAQVIRGGASIIQLRCKECTHKDFLNMARYIKEICREKGVLFIVNDSLEIALAVKADGLHVGQEDMPAGELKKMLPIDMILGCSIGNLEEARQAYKEGADYLGVGAMFATTTKASVDVIGLDKIKQIKKAVELPIVAIGGINKGNIKEVMEAGADAAAVISAVMGADDVKKATSELLNIIRGPESG